MREASLLFCLLRFSSLCPPNRVENEQEDNRAESGHQKIAQVGARKGILLWKKQRQHEAAYERPNDANDDVAQAAKRWTAHDHTCQPSSQATNQYPGQ